MQYETGVALPEKTDSVQLTQPLSLAKVPLPISNHSSNSVPSLSAYFLMGMAARPMSVEAPMVSAMPCTSKQKIFSPGTQWADGRICGVLLLECPPLVVFCWSGACKACLAAPAWHKPGRTSEVRRVP